MPLSKQPSAHERPLPQMQGDYRPGNAQFAHPMHPNASQDGAHQYAPGPPQQTASYNGVPPQQHMMTYGPPQPHPQAHMQGHQQSAWAAATEGIHRELSTDLLERNSMDSKIYTTIAETIERSGLEHIGTTRGELQSPLLNRSLVHVMVHDGWTGASGDDLRGQRCPEYYDYSSDGDI